MPKISALPITNAASTGDLLVLDQGSVTKRIDFNVLQSAIANAGTVKSLIEIGGGNPNYLSVVVGGIASVSDPNAIISSRINVLNQSGLTVVNAAVSPPVDPWFHVNSSGIGGVGDGTHVPFFSIESDTGLSKEIRFTVDADSADPAANAFVWAKSTNHATHPLGLFLRADNQINIQAGISNSLTDNVTKITLGATGGIDFAGALGTNQFQVIFTVGATHNLTVTGSTTNPVLDATGGAIRLSSGTADIQWGKANVALGGGAAPTVGTIGGSGPSAAAQRNWLRFIESDGTASFIPVWR